MRTHDKSKNIRNRFNRWNLTVKNFQHYLDAWKLGCLRLWNSAAVKFLTFRDEYHSEFEGNTHELVLFLLFCLSVYLVAWLVAEFSAMNLGIFWIPTTFGVTLYFTLQVWRLFYGNR